MPLQVADPAEGEAQAVQDVVPQELVDELLEHALPHRCVPDGQAQAEPWQVIPPLQAFPHPHVVLESLVVSTQLEPQAVKSPPSSWPNTSDRSRGSAHHRAGAGDGAAAAVRGRRHIRLATVGLIVVAIRPAGHAAPRRERALAAAPGRGHDVGQPAGSNRCRSSRNDQRLVARKAPAVADEGTGGAPAGFAIGLALGGHIARRRVLGGLSCVQGRVGAVVRTGRVVARTHGRLRGVGARLFERVRVVPEDQVAPRLQDHAGGREELPLAHHQVPLI